MIQRQRFSSLVAAMRLALLAGALGAARMGAQSTVATPIGARVRVLLPDSVRAASFGPRGRALVGILARRTTDTLWLDVGSPDTVRLARASIRSVQVSRGASRFASAVELGLVAGTTYAIVAAASAPENARGRRALQFGIGSAAFGALVGALRPYERWGPFRP
jgi:hypothetical protein